MLSKLNSDPVADDLIQNPVWYGKDKNNADCLFFYSSGTVEWTYYKSVDSFKHTGNDYSDVTRITSYNVCYTKLLRNCGCGRF